MLREQVLVEWNKLQRKITNKINRLQIDQQTVYYTCKECYKKPRRGGMSAK